MSDRSAILEALAGTTWLMPPDDLRRIAASAELAVSVPEHVGARRPSVPAQLADGAYQPPKADDPMGVWRYGSVAVLPVQGPMFHGNEAWMRWMGWCSYQDIAKAAHALAADPSVGSICVMFNSPGGTVAGITEAADAFKAMSKAKPTVAISRDMMTSGAAWLSCLCRQVVTTPTGLLGSVGAIGGYFDTSEAGKLEGIEARIYVTGRFKGAGFPYTKVTDEQLASKGRQLEDAFSLFVSDVAKGRRMSEDDVRALEAEVFSGRLGVKAGLADSVESFESVVLRLEETYGSSVDGAAGAFPSSPRSSGSDSDEARLGRKEPGMAGENKLDALTFEQLAAAKPELVEKIRADAIASVREKPATVADLKARFNDDTFVVAQATKGATMSEASAAFAAQCAETIKARDARNGELVAENGKLSAKITELEKQVATLKGAARGADPVGRVDDKAEGDGGGGGGGGGGKDYMSLVKAKAEELVTKDKIKPAAAMQMAHQVVRRTNPKEHMAYVRGLKPAEERA